MLEEKVSRNRQSLSRRPTPVYAGVSIHRDSFYTHISAYHIVNAHRIAINRALGLIRTSLKRFLGLPNFTVKSSIVGVIRD
jgi:hypothetical protein